MTRELDLGGRGLREHAARGTLVNAAFSAGLAGLGLVRALVVAALVTAADFGVWGIVVVTFATLAWLRSVGVSDRYIQQDESDQEAAFQRAFSMEVLVSAAYLALVLAAVPLVALAFGRPEVVAPALVLCLIVPAGALQAPIWVFHRQMRFVRQRALLAVDPVVAFVVTIAAATAGAGFWAFVAGAVAGAWAGAAAAVVASPYRLRWRLDRTAARAYLRFSWPLFVSGLAGVVTAQAAVLTANHTLGLAAVGAMALAASLSEAVHRVDAVVTDALYPAVCRVADRVELLREAFSKSNRLTLMVAAPAGVGLALFAQALVDHVLGQRWQIAVVLLQALGVAAAINHVGFNWTAFVQARGDTRPMIGWALANAAAFFCVAIPLLVVAGLDGYAAGLLVVALVSLLVRARALASVLGAPVMWRLTARGAAPVLPAAAAVLVARVLAAPDLAQLALYVAVVTAATVLLERRLLREAVALLRRPRGVALAGPA